jgi:long-chain fatty acid transport protein
MSAQAAGFYVSEIGTPGSVGTAGSANVTNTWGPDAAWANPAGLAWQERTTLATGLQIIAPSLEFDTDVADAGGEDGGNAGDIAVVPSLFYAQRLSENWSFGFGFSALQGGGVSYGDDFVGRYAATDVLLTGIGATYSFGYRVNDRLAIGFGASIIYSQFEQDIALNLDPLPDGKVKIQDADDLGVQPIVGLQYAFTDRLLFGMTYRAEFDSELKGNVRFKRIPDGVPLPQTTNVELDWTNPQWLEAGFRYGDPRGLVLFVRGNWQEWSQFSDNQITIDSVLGNDVVTLDRDWDDTWSVAVGLGRIGADAGNGWSVGVAYESSPADDDVRTIDFAVDESWRFSAAYGHFDETRRGWSVGTTLAVFGDAKVDQTAQGVRFAGEFDEYYVLYLSGTLRF